MFGNNPKRAPIKGDGAVLDIQSIFKTFQGEGPFVGWPAVFVRLGGCNLSCDFCDTEFESYQSMACDDIVFSVMSLATDEESQKRTHPLVVITGGEPFRQPIERLCQALLDAKFAVQIETNGTLFRSVPEQVNIVCSPKNTGQGYFPVRDDLLPYIDAFKFIISSVRDGYQQVAEIGQSKHHTPVYIQPMDEYDPDQNRKNMAYVLSMAEKHGYRISLQTHKILDIE
jgi:organic radical activating enzyme